jgi:hypothetical protein
MAKGLNALVIGPMGKKHEEMEEEESSDGLREAFDEFEAATAAGDSDAAFEALRNFTDMCAMKAGDY